MLSKHKQPSLEAGLLIVLLVISIFSIGFLSEGKVSGIFGKEEGLEKVTGNIVKVTGMAATENGPTLLRKIEDIEKKSKIMHFSSSQGSNDDFYILFDEEQKIWRISKDQTNWANPLQHTLSSQNKDVTALQTQIIDVNRIREADERYLKGTKMYSNFMSGGIIDRRAGATLDDTQLYVVDGTKEERIAGDWFGDWPGANKAITSEQLSHSITTQDIDQAYNLYQGYSVNYWEEQLDKDKHTKLESSWGGLTSKTVDITEEKKKEAMEALSNIGTKEAQDALNDYASKRGELYPQLQSYAKELSRGMVITSTAQQRDISAKVQKVLIGDKKPNELTQEDLAKLTPEQLQILKDSFKTQGINIPAALKDALETATPSEPTTQQKQTAAAIQKALILDKDPSKLIQKDIQNLNQEQLKALESSLKTQNKPIPAVLTQAIKATPTTTTTTLKQPLISRSGSEWIVKDSAGQEHKYPSISEAKQKFIEETNIYLEQKIKDAKARGLEKVVENYNNKIEKILAEMSRSESTDISYYNNQIKRVENLVDEMNAQLRPASEHAHYLGSENEIDRKAAEDYFSRNKDNEEALDALVYEAGSNEFAKEKLIQYAFEGGESSTAFEKLVRYDELNDASYSSLLAQSIQTKEEIKAIDPTAAAKLSVDSNGWLYDRTNLRYIDGYDVQGKNIVFKHGTQVPTTAVPGEKKPPTGLEAIKANFDTNNFPIDEKTGIITDTKGNIYGEFGKIKLVKNANGKWIPDPSLKVAPEKLSDGTPISEKKGWLTEDGKKIYEAGGKLYPEDTNWKIATKTSEYLKTTDQNNPVKIRTMETIGETDKDGIVTRGALIRKTITIDEKGDRDSKTGDIAIVPSGNPKDKDYGKDIPIDTETLSLIKSTVGAKGTITTTGNQKEGAEIKFTTQDGKDTTIITYSKDYKIEANKLTGIKSQIDFSYTLDTDHNGEITQEERDADKYAQMTTRFTATSEDNGKVNRIWYADDFRFGSDGYYFADMYMQAYDINTGKPQGEQIYYYIEGGKKGDDNAAKIDIKIEKGEPVAESERKVIKVVNGKAIDPQTGGDLTNEPEGQRAIKRASQAASRRWFANLEFKLTQFKGLSGWSQLIFSDEDMAKWREGVDKIFSSLYLGTDYWVSGICAKHIPKQQAGTFMMKTKDGLFDVVAHVEGEKTIIKQPNGSAQYIYKLTFSVRNPKYSQYEQLKFNVYLYGGRTVELYPQDIEVKDGKSFTRGPGKRENGQVTYDKEHGKPIVQYSNYNYDRICIKFKHAITNAEGKREDAVCNSIVEYKGSPTEYEKRVTATGTVTPAAEEPYQEADF